MWLLSQSRVLDVGLSKEEAIRRLGCVTGTRCTFCRARIRTRAEDVFCSECGHGLSNPLHDSRVPPPLPAFASGVPQNDCVPLGPIRFEGSIAKDGFQITPVRTWRNNRSVTPVITGNIRAAPGGARISVAMQAELFATVFGVIYISVAVLVFLVMISAGASPEHFLIPVFMAAVAFITLTLSFKLEANQAYRILGGLWSS